MKEEYECYVLECMHCGEKKFINKKNNLMSIFERGCSKCHSKKARWELIGEGKFENNKIHIPNQVNRESEDYIFSNLRKRW